MMDGMSSGSENSMALVNSMMVMCVGYSENRGAVF